MGNISYEIWLSELRKKLNERDFMLVKEAVNTLYKNIGVGEGMPWKPYRCIMPCHNGFEGIWNWDSAFHAVGASNWDADLAKEQILGFCQYQCEDGMYPDVIRMNGSIEQNLWNEDLKAYADVNRFTHETSNVLTPASFMPMFIKTASEERAEYMHRLAKDKKKFFPGMPTVAYDSPEYSSDYWRGPTWLNIAYFAAKGLKNYGYDKVASDIKQTILGWVEKTDGITYENYNLNGEGMGAVPFSWSAVFVIEFILNF